MKRVYKSYAAFRKGYAIWGEHGYLIRIASWRIISPTRRAL
jgi:hypothetical protein